MWRMGEGAGTVHEGCLPELRLCRAPAVPQKPLDHQQEDVADSAGGLRLGLQDIVPPFWNGQVDVADQKNGGSPRPWQTPCGEVMVTQLQPVPLGLRRFRHRHGSPRYLKPCSEA